MSGKGCERSGIKLSWKFQCTGNAFHGQFRDTSWSPHQGRAESVEDDLMGIRRRKDLAPIMRALCRGPEGATIQVLITFMRIWAKVQENGPGGQTRKPTIGGKEIERRVLK